MTDKEMTDKEAIEIIKVARAEVEWEYPMEYAAAFDKAIEALEQEPILDKIRAEIADLADADAYGDYQQGFNFGLMRAAQIIDKYKFESEDKE